MKIHVHLVPKEGLVLEGEEPCSILDLTDPEWTFAEPVGYRLEANVISEALLVTGRVWTRGRVRCSRCLKEFGRLLEVREFLAHTPIGSSDIVDLTPEIRESILLEIPQKALCREDCKGLCCICGCDLNTETCACAKPPRDLRWAGLDELEP